MKRIKKNEFEYYEKQAYSDDTDDSRSVNVSSSEKEVSGKIETLQMTNFMCHSNLELTLNKRVNFITGKNGSGKSSIMTALIIVLGGTATVTGRGSSVADFIKTGENTAKITVTLMNNGTNSFKRELYGSRIIISRTISRTSGNSYVCKSYKGGIVSKKKEEVDNIVLAFNLQIKNPICILNQDVARSFLCMNDSSSRFEMFVKATQLEDLKNIYINTLRTLESSENQLKIKLKGIEEARREVSQLKDKLNYFESLSKRVQEKKDLENEYRWSVVIEEETKLRELEEKKDRFLEKKEQIGNGKSNLENGMKSFDEEVKICEKRIQELKNSNAKEIEDKIELQGKMKVLDKEAKCAEEELRNLEMKKKKKKEEISGVEKYLKEKDAIDGQSQAEREKTKKEISDLHRRLSEGKVEMEEAKKKLVAAQEVKLLHSRNLENSKADLGELEQNKKRLEILLAGTRNRGQDRLLKYGQYTSQILKAIEDASKSNRFVHKPVGPCGMYVSLSGDPKWARAVESVIGGLMTTYCCDNLKDFKELSRIMDKICGSKQPPIIISKFHQKRHNVDSMKVSFRDFPSVLDVLSFDNDVVFNTFIDQSRIETILLFETDSQAASVLTQTQNVPKNLRMGLTVLGDQYFPAPNYRTYYGDSNRNLRYFVETKSGDSVKKLEAELKDAIRETNEKTAEIAKLNEQYQEICEELWRKENKLRKLRQNEKEIELKLSQLKDILESQPVNKTKIVLEEELELLKTNFKELSTKLFQIENSVLSIKEKKTELVKKIESLSSKEDSVAKELSCLEMKLEEKKLEHRKLSKKMDRAKSELAEIKDKLKLVEAEIENSVMSLEKKKKAAEEAFPERLDTKRSPEEVQKLLEKCDKYLKTAEKMAGSKEEVEEEFKEKVERFRKMKAVAKSLTVTIENLKRTAREREKRLRSVQSLTSSSVSSYFQAILKTRGYDGQLIVDFQNKSLDLEVKPKDASIARKDSKTLSGGERSYSTVSFILAIWKIVNMPIYFLDEFDVFMDKINRKVIMDLLLEHAKDQTNVQFVFITPQDVSVQSSDFITLFKLQDPVRKQV